MCEKCPLNLWLDGVCESDSRDNIQLDKYGIMINLYGKFKFSMNVIWILIEFIDFIIVTNFVST